MTSAVRAAEISTERLSDVPTSLGIGADGCTHGAGTSMSTADAAQDEYTRRGPGVGMIKFMP